MGSGERESNNLITYPEVGLDTLICIFVYFENLGLLSDRLGELLNGVVVMAYV